jgi:hypothetical protein
MARACTICNNPKASEINEALVRGESHRAVAKRFNASAPSMFRHQDHLSAVLAKAADVRASVGELMAGDNLVQKVQELETTARRITAAAEAAGDPRTALVGLRELARMIELTAKITGRLDGDSGQGGATRSITINFPVMSPEQMEAVNNAPTIDLPPMARRLLQRPSDGHQR